MTRRRIRCRRITTGATKYSRVLRVKKVTSMSPDLLVVVVGWTTNPTTETTATTAMAVAATRRACGDSETLNTNHTVTSCTRISSDENARHVVAAETA